MTSPYYVILWHIRCLNYRFGSYQNKYALPYLISKPIACLLSKILSLEMWYLWVCSAESPGHHLWFSIIVSFGKLYFPQLSDCVVLVGLTLVPIPGMNSQSYGFSSSHVWMWDLDHKEGWMPKNWCFQIVVLEKTLKSPSDCKEIEPVNPKGKLPWILIRRTDAEAEAPILWPPDVKSWLVEKDPYVGKDWGQEETDDETVGWLHRLNKHEFEQPPGDR